MVYPDTSSPFQRWAPVLVLGMFIDNPFCLHFHGLFGFAELLHTEKLFMPSSSSLPDGTPSISTFNLRQHTKKRLQTDLRCRAYVYGWRILTPFPFLYPVKVRVRSN